MGKQVFLQASKEFQAKLALGAIDAHMSHENAETLLFRQAAKAIGKAVRQAAGDRRHEIDLPEAGWRREGIRYDTAPDRSGRGLFRHHNLTLAVEASDEKTKLKCKQHHFMPELLFESPKASVCHPKPGLDGAKLKLEQDLHFDNAKFCASGSVFIEGRQTDVQDLRFFSRRFPGLKELAPSATPLRVLSHWDETVYDKLLTRIGKIEFEWMLVNRWDHDPSELLESELSFKLVKSIKDDWDRKALDAANRLYLALGGTGAFMAYPPIFLYRDPVASVDIIPARK
jgi:hypothetical protein